MNFFQQEMIDAISTMQEDTLIQTQEKINQLFKMAALAQSIWGQIPNFKICNNSADSNLIDHIAINDITEAVLSSESQPYLVIDDTDEQSSSSVPLLHEMELICSSVPIELSEETDQSEPSLAEITDDMNEWFIPEFAEIPSYPLERKLRGGLLNVHGSVVFVPERVIRQQGFVHGDYLTIERLDEKNNNFIKVKDSTTAHECVRVEVDYCIVSKSTDNLLISNKYLVDGELKPIMLNNETPLTFLITEDDQQRFNLKEGMFVTIAYHQNNPLRKRVCWAYSVEVQPHITPKPASHYKEINGEKKPIWSDEERTILQGKKVVLLGGNVKTSEVETIAKDGDFEIEILTGFENTKRIENTLQSANLILSATAHLSHRSAERAKQLAKELRITHRIVQSSLCSIKNGILHGLKNKEQLLVSLF